MSSESAIMEEDRREAIRQQELANRRVRLGKEMSDLKGPQLIGGDISLGQLDAEVFRPLESFPTFRWWMALAVTGSFASMFFFCFVYTFVTGIGGPFGGPLNNYILIACTRLAFCLLPPTGGGFL